MLDSHTKNYGSRRVVSTRRWNFYLDVGRRGVLVVELRDWDACLMLCQETRSIPFVLFRSKVFPLPAH